MEDHSPRPSAEAIRHDVLHWAGHRTPGLSDILSRKHRITPRTAQRHIKRACDEGLIEPSEGVSTYKLAVKELLDVTLRMQETDSEDKLWQEHAQPHILPKENFAYSAAHHVFTEMVNNAIDHSESETLRLSLHQTALWWSFMVQDKGVGIFAKIMNHLGIHSEPEAILELSKGKLTTDPTRHSGEGVFFSSKLSANFAIHSGLTVFAPSSYRRDKFLIHDSLSGEYVDGTTVHFVIDRDMEIDPQDVWDAFTVSDEDGVPGFQKTIIRAKRLTENADKLISRSQAKRLLFRMDQFSELELDFGGVDYIGQAFADEIYRVFLNQNPTFRIHTIGACPKVTSMIRRTGYKGTLTPEEETEN